MKPRVTMDLHDGWLFQADERDAGEREQWPVAGLPDGKPVSVPHTWNVEAGWEDYRGAGWYEYRFAADPAWAGKTVRVMFEAVYRDAAVWLNGVLLGSHTGSGYTSFAFDMSSGLRFGQPNRLVVRVDNRGSEQALPCARSFDWADDGGLIRGVKLIVTGKQAIDCAQVHAVPEFPSEPDSPVRGRIYGTLRFSRMEASRLSISAAVYRENRLVAEGRREWVGVPGDCLAALPELRLDEVDLWHFDHPNLYTLAVAVHDDDGISDRIEIAIGFREIVLDGDRLMLNREAVRLVGVEWMPGSHPDMGMAETPDETFARLRQIKEANCVITRFHWQQDEALLDWCDRNGLLVQEEIPHWQQPAVPGDALLPLSLQHAREMILRHFNHPSIFAWGMANEIDGQHPDTSAFLEKLKREMRKLDPGRFVNYVSNTLHLDPAKDAAAAGDIICWNEYIGTWHEDLDRRATIQGIVAAHPGKPIAVSEFGLCEPAFSGGDPRRAQILTDNLTEYRMHPEIACVIFFSLNDYRTQMGEAGEGRFRQRVHGSTDLYGNPKPSWHVLREWASPIRAIHAEKMVDDEVRVTLAVRDDLPCHAIRGYRISASTGDGLACSATIPDALPNESKTVILRGHFEDSEALSIRIDRPTGFSVIEQAIRLT